MKRPILISLSLAVSLAACDLSRMEERAAGTLPNNGGAFGVAYQNNFLVQAAYLNSDARIVDMSRKFQAEVDPVVNFAFNSARLGPEARATLDRQAAWLKAHPTVRMRVYGHTDLVGSDAYNQRLGLRRARATVRYLRSRGIAANRLDAVISLGESEPVVPTQAPERRNRRTVTDVAGFASGFVGDGLDGKRALLGYNQYVRDRGEAPAAEGTGG